MKTSTNTTSETKLVEAFALWESTGKTNNTVYYTGKTSSEDSVRLVAFINTVKKNPNMPDIQVYEQTEKGKEKPQVASLWENKSKAGKQYLSGQDNEEKKLVGFYNTDTKGGKYPKIRVYYSDQK